MVGLNEATTSQRAATKPVIIWERVFTILTPRLAALAVDGHPRIDLLVFRRMSGESRSFARRFHFAGRPQQRGDRRLLRSIIAKSGRISEKGGAYLAREGLAPAL